MRNNCVHFILAVCFSSFSLATSGAAQRPISVRSDPAPSSAGSRASESSPGVSNEVGQSGRLPAADACASIQAALDDLPATGGTIDARGFEGKQTCNTKVVLSKPVTVLLGAAEFEGEGLWYVTSSGVVIRGLSQGSTVVRYRGVGTPSAVIELGRDPSGTSVTEAIVGIEISNLTVDANSQARSAIFGFHIERGLVDNVAALNANGNANMSFYGLTESATMQSRDITVQNCYISGNTTTAAYGDGIYFSGIVRPRAINNTISDVTRIGIVTEGDGPGRKSSDALIAHNTIFNVHDHGAGNLNAAIWLENTNGGRVIGNHGFDLSGGVQRGGSRGIVIAGGSDVPSTFAVTSNIISGAKEPLVIDVTAGSTVLAEGFAMYAGNVNDGYYRLGVVITRGRVIRINNIFFGDNDFTRAGGSTGGLVVVYASGDIESLSITNATKGTIVHNPPFTADINISNLRGFTLNHLSLSGLRAPPGDEWTYRRGGTGTVGRMTVVDSDFSRTPTSGSFPPGLEFVYGPGDDLHIVNRLGSAIRIGTGREGKVLIGADGGPMAQIGQWPGGTSSVFVGHGSLDQTAHGNYALMQTSAGQTVLNSAAGQELNFRRNNDNLARFNTNGTYEVMAGTSAALNSVAFSSTPVFDASLGNTQKIILTGNVTSSTISNATLGQWLFFIICQDSAGGRTFAWPSNVRGGMTVGSTANTCSAQSFIFDGRNAYAVTEGTANLPRSQ